MQVKTYSKKFQAVPQHYVMKVRVEMRFCLIEKVKPAHPSGNVHKVTTTRIQAPTGNKTPVIQSMANFLTNRAI
jgi:hypothetical protein